MHYFWSAEQCICYERVGGLQGGEARNAAKQERMRGRHDFYLRLHDLTTRWSGG